MLRSVLEKCEMNLDICFINYQYEKCSFDLETFFLLNVIIKW